MPPPIPYARELVWVAAQFHLTLAAFLLGGPIFVVICEYIGHRTGERRYDLLAREIMRLLMVVATLTMGFGTLLTFFLIALYPRVTTYLMESFFPLFAVYGLLILGEALFLYSYYYTWDSLSKRWHLTLGIMLNLFGTAILFAMNSVTTFMMTPPKELWLGASVGLWTAINNAAWWPLNFHRLIANVTLGGYLTGFYAAVRYLSARRDAERAHYDWMGFTGNFIGTATLMILPVIGFIFANELSAYSRHYMLYTMPGNLSWFFVMQGFLITLLFIGIAYYFWLNIRRLELGAVSRPRLWGHVRRLKGSMIGVTGVALVGGLVWVMPHHFMSTMFMLGGHAGAEIPKQLEFLALMVAKNSAVTSVILVGFFAYMLHRYGARLANHFGVAIPWGKIDVRAMYTLAFLAYIVVLLMSLMGFIRSQARGDWHVVGVMANTYTSASQPPTWYALMMIGLISLAFMGLFLGIIWFSDRVLGKPKIAEGE